LGKPLVQGQQCGVGPLGDCDIGGVVGPDGFAQLKDSGKEEPVRVAGDSCPAEVIEGIRSVPERRFSASDQPSQGSGDFEIEQLRRVYVRFGKALAGQRPYIP
jgi:hypothetical protein